MTHNTFEERLRFIMAHEKLNIARLAELADVSSPAISRIMAGKNGMSPRTARILASNLGLNVKWLLTGEGPIWSTLDRSDIINTYANELLKQPESFKTLFTIYMSRLDDKDWDAIEKLANKLLETMEESKKEKDQPKEPQGAQPEEPPGE